MKSGSRSCASFNCPDPGMSSCKFGLFVRLMERIKLCPAEGIQESGIAKHQILYVYIYFIVQLQVVYFSSELYSYMPMNIIFWWYHKMSVDFECWGLFWLF